MRKPPVLLISLVLSVAIVSATSVKAYVLEDYRWPSATTTFNVDMPGADGLWNTAFESAMARWNAATIFEFRIKRDTFESPCDGLPTRTTGGDSENGVAFVSDVCGEAFGENTLAVESSWSQGTRTIQSNIHFNDTYSWNVYDGPYQTGSRTGIVDFRRVAVHELGHALGLNHEDDVPAIMVTSISRGDTIVAPQADDIAGVAALYGTGTSRAPTAPHLLIPANNARDVSLTTTLSWSRVTNADSYDVYFGTSSNPFGNNLRLVRNTTGTTYRPSSLAPNTTYYWSIRAKNSDGTARSATYRFTTILPAPPNDRFSGATRITGRSGRATGSNVGATDENGESGLGTKSVWWRWQAPDNGRLTLGTIGSNFDTTLGVYTGIRVSSLQSMAENDDANGQQSRVMLDVTAGTTYQFRVAGYDGGTGQIVLNWNLQEPQITFEHQYVFPQFVFGGGWASTLTVQALGDGPTTCRLTAGGRVLPTWRDISSGQEAMLNLDEWHFQVLKTGNTGSLSSGMAMLECNKEVWTHVLVSLASSGGSTISEALVEPAEPDRWVVFVADHRGGSRFGVAVANPSDQAIEVKVSVTGLADGDEKEVEVSIPPHESKAFFLDELYDIPKDHLGGVSLWSDAGRLLYVIGLRFTGQVFTTIPAW